MVPTSADDPSRRKPLPRATERAAVRLARETGVSAEVCRNDLRDASDAFVAALNRVVDDLESTRQKLRNARMTGFVR